MFLNSGKIEVAANSSAEIKITVPTKALVGNCSDFGNRCKRGSLRGRNRSLDNFQLP